MARGDLSAKSLETGLPVECRSLVQRDYRVVRSFMVAIALLQAVYAVSFVFRSSVVIEGRRYFCLFDDAMISMRYADNCVQGLGLVWNPGERVEGFTNLAWTLVMVACHLFPLSPSGHCLVVQLMGIPVLWACLLAVLRLAKACRLLPWAAAIAVVLTATYYNLTYFTLLGMETGLFTAMVTAGLSCCVNAVRTGRASATGLLWFALAGLVRPEALLLAMFVFSFLLVSVRAGRRRVVAGFAVVAGVQAALTAWRLCYYGEWLSNTAYLKATGWPLLSRLDPGIEQLLITVGTTALPLLLSLSVLLSPRRWHWLLLGTFGVALLYQTYVGGDACPLNRFVVPAIGGIFVLAGQGAHRLPALFKTHGNRRRIAVLRVMIVILVIAVTNAVHWDHYSLIAPHQTACDNRMNLRLWLALDRTVDRHGSVAVVWAGTVPYYSQRRSVDLLGKCDSHIARLSADLTRPRAGHNKFDLEYSLSRYKPGVVLHAISTNLPVFARDYRAVSVTVDGVRLAFCVRKDLRVSPPGDIIDFQTAGRILTNWQEMGRER